MIDRKNSQRPGRPDDLRARAEKRLRDKAVSAPKSGETPSPGETLRLIHELQVHQIELEMQNEELRRAQAELEVSRARYADLYEFAPMGYLTLSDQGLILEANLTAATLLGVGRGALAGQPFAHFVLPEDQDSFHLFHNQLREQGASPSSELRMVRAGSPSFWVHLQAVSSRDGGCRILLNDITESRKLEEAQLFLVEAGYRHREENFFKALARFLAESLGMDYVCIDRLHGDELSARTVAVYADGRFEDNVDYALKDTPCGEAVGKTICRFDAGVRTLFPRDAVLQELAAESYVGTTLWSFDGRPIGLIAVIGRRPLANPRLAESLLRLVAVRAAGELERTQAEEEMRALARFPAENPNPVLRVGRSGVILYANEAGQGLLRDWGCSVGEAAPAAWAQAVSESLAGGAPRTVEATLGQQTWSVFLAPIAGAGYVNLYASSVTELKRAEWALRERYKEMRCLYGISVLLETPGDTLPETLGRIVELIPEAMQFPEFAAARITLPGQTFTTAGFRESPAMMVSEVLVNDAVVGEVAVAYLEGRPPAGEGPFLGEERLLLDAVAKTLGRLLGHVRTEEAARENEERYRVIVESSRDLIFILDAEGRLLWHNPAARELLGTATKPTGDEKLFTGVHPEDSHRVAAAWRSVRDEGENPGRLQYRFRDSGGRYRTLESTFRKIALAGKERWCVIATDMTELMKLRQKVSVQQGIAGMVGRDPKMLELYSSLRELAAVDVPVLILGESGTGKELIASAIHREGPRAAKNFVAINCGAIPDTLLETELFGHVRGSFTGAHRDKKGRFELADGGTVFLDEVGELSPSMQVKLLRVLQEGTFERVGDEKPTKVDVRLISATNKDLASEVKAGRFRADLYYRLSVVPLKVPPLRERLVDIPLLAEHILGEEASRADRRRDPSRPPLKVSLAGETLALLLAHRWPGNVRELQNVLRFAMIKRKGNVIRPEDLPHSLTAPAGLGLVSRGRKPKITADLAKEALERAGGRPAEAARLLGVSRATFYRHLPKET